VWQRRWGKREGTGKVLIMQPQFWCPIKYKIFSCVKASLWCGAPQLMWKKAWCVWACEGGDVWNNSLNQEQLDHARDHRTQRWVNPLVTSTQFRPVTFEIEKCMTDDFIPWKFLVIWPRKATAVT